MLKKHPLIFVTVVNTLAAICTIYGACELVLQMGNAMYSHKIIFSEMH